MSGYLQEVLIAATINCILWKLYSKSGCQPRKWFYLNFDTDWVIYLACLYSMEIKKSIYSATNCSKYKLFMPKKYVGFVTKSCRVLKSLIWTMQYVVSVGYCNLSQVTLLQQGTLFIRALNLWTIFLFKDYINSPDISSRCKRCQIADIIKDRLWL